MFVDHSTKLSIIQFVVPACVEFLKSCFYLFICQVLADCHEFLDWIKIVKIDRIWIEKLTFIKFFCI